MTPNLLVLIATAFIPFLIAYAWFHPKVFGGETWARISNLSEANAAVEISPLKLLFSILLNFLIAFGLFALTIHQFSVFGLVGADPELLKTGTGLAFMNEFGGRHLSFGHGIAHGVQATIAFVVPILGYATIFERKGGKYFLVNLGFWLVSLILMAGVLAQWGANSI